VLIGAGFAYLQFSQQQQASHELLISNQVAKGYELLGNQKVVVQLGGIYALEGVMNASEQYHQPVLEALCAFVRDNTRSHIEASPTTETQAALTVIGRRSAGSGLVDLTDAQIPKAGLSDANLSEADLTGANLTGANFDGANLSGAKLYNANLTGAHLLRANLTGADLAGANLSHARLSYAKLSGADLRPVFCPTCAITDLTGADLEGAELTGASLSGANLSGANLSGRSTAISRLLGLLTGRLQ
jgi:uncharacterized protein YjbI with pentapeptide repeats